MLFRRSLPFQTLIHACTMKQRPLIHATVTFSPCRSLFKLIRKEGSEEDARNPYSLIKEDGIEVLSHLWIDSFKNSLKTPQANLTCYLKRFELWLLAYQKVYADETGELPVRSSITREVLDNLLSLRNAILESKFKWGLNGDYYIRSPNDKFRVRASRKAKMEDSGMPFQDRIVQEVLFMILEPVFEPRFSQRSYAFRPGRNAQTVLRVIRSKFGGYLWFLKGDLSFVLGGLKPTIVMSCVSKVVKDKKIIGLIRSALMTPVVNAPSVEKRKGKKPKSPKSKVFKENEPKPDPYWLDMFFGFAPAEAARVPKWGHCGVLSPLLANICLNELDHWVEEKISEFYKPSSTDVIWKNPLKPGSYNPSWPEFIPASGREKTRKMDYVRYGCHFLIGVRGPRGGAVYIRNRLIEFCEETYGFELMKERFPVEHITRGILFLDHVICRRVVYPTLRYSDNHGKIVSKKSVGTLLSVTVNMEECIRKFRKLRLLKGDRDPDPQPCTRMFYATQAHCNMQMNKFLDMIAEWYRYADNRKKGIRFCSYIIRGSLAKLYASKYKLRSRAKVFKAACRDLSRPLKKRGDEIPSYEDLLRMGLLDAIHGIKFSNNSLIPPTDYAPFPPDWIPEHEKILLEYIHGLTPKTLKNQLNLLEEKGVTTPQDYMSKLVWSFKVYGIFRGGKLVSKVDTKEPKNTQLPDKES